MDTSLLDSIVNITGQRDIESLEFSLLTALAKLLPVREITLNKLGENFDIHYVQSVTSYVLDKQGEGHIDFSWEDIPRLVALDGRATHSLNTGSSEYFFDDTGFYVASIPVAIDKDIPLLLIIISESDMTDNQSMIEGMVSVYANYRYVLNESSCDKLTGLLNRRTFDGKFQKLLDVQSQRKSIHRPVSSTQQPRIQRDNEWPWLAIVDIDHFKNVNDTYGHVIGDEVLLLLSQLIKSSFRDSDLSFRFGGEEFVVLLEPITEKMAFEVLTRFSAAVASYEFPQVGKITVSIGFAKINKGDFPTEVLGRADQSLYYVKKHGRNGVREYNQLQARGLLKGSKKTGTVELF